MSATRALRKAMSLARPASLSSKRKRASLPSAVMRSPTVPLVSPCLLEDRVHFGLQRAQFFLAALMDLVRRHARGGPGPQRPGVVLIAARQFPHSGIARGAAAMRLRVRQSGGRARARSCRPRFSQRGPQSPGIALARFASEVTSDHSRDVSPARELDLAQCLVEQEIGRDHVLRRGALQPSGLAVELARVRLEACQ